MKEDFARIKINRQIADKFYQSVFYRENENISLTQLVNNLLDMFIDGRLVRLDDANFDEVKKCADQLGKTNKEIVNLILERIELVVAVNPPKVKLEVETPQNKLKVNKKIRVNSVINW